MTRDEFAAKLNGREYGGEITKQEATTAREARLLVVFGASDDTTEFRGVYDDEAGAYEGGLYHFVRVGETWELTECPGTGVEIEVVWEPDADDAPDASWFIRTSIPHSKFDIIEEGAFFCRGVVIDEKDMLSACKVKLTRAEVDAAEVAIDRSECEKGNETLAIVALTAAALARLV